MRGGRTFQREHVAGEKALPDYTGNIQYSFCAICSSSAVAGLRTVKNFELSVAVGSVVMTSEDTIKEPGLAWILAYCPEGANVTNLVPVFELIRDEGEDEPPFHALVAANQWVLAAGICQPGSVARKITTRGRRLNNGDRILLMFIQGSAAGFEGPRVMFSCSYDIAYN